MNQWIKQQSISRTAYLPLKINALEPTLVHYKSYRNMGWYIWVLRDRDDVIFNDSLCQTYSHISSAREI